MRTKIFSYKGIIGAETDIDNGKFINDPTNENQFGCVISTDEVDITAEAKELIKNAPRESGSYAPIMLTKHTDGSSSVGLFGFWKHLFAGKDLRISRDCDTTILDECTEVEMTPPEGFVKMIEENL